MKRKIEKLAIANRGEVAVRIIQACKELGIETVLLHSEVDANTIAYRMSDEQVCIGPAVTSESYLNIENNVNAALSADVDAVHPGFGFLSENADFAQACNDRRLLFVGPSPEAIRLFGDKVSAKKTAEEAGAPVIPGYQGEDQSIETLMVEMEKIGFPVIVKAAGGGGGRGLKLVNEASEAKQAVESAMREGESSFGSSRIFLEKYLGNAKHIEVQIFADLDGKVFHLYERECSVQRRHQKVIEEALSPSLTESMRQEICQAAVNIAKHGKYFGAGTVEFLFEDGKFYFLEVNTRLQVEHPVTEMVMGVDLVKAQILAVQGTGPMWSQEELLPRGHAIECRIYAEDSYRSGMPSTGLLGGCHWPAAPGRRFEIGFEAGDEITSFYDSMFAKVIVWDETRARSIQKMKKTLHETVVFGVKTNIPYLLEILGHQEFIDGSMTTQFISKYLANGLVENSDFDEVNNAVIDSVNTVLATPLGTEASSSVGSPWTAQWERLGKS